MEYEVVVNYFRPQANRRLTSFERQKLGEEVEHVRSDRNRKLTSYERQ